MSTSAAPPPGPRVDAAAVAERVAAVRRRITAAAERAGRDPAGVTLVAVAKLHPVAAIRAALDAGVADVGENYAQELLTKQAALSGAAPRWHFIGRLQSNKVRKLAPHVHLWQSVDRLALGAEIARRAPGAAVLLQVNLSRETTKGGCPPGDVPALVEGLRGLGLDIRGLMTVGPLAEPEHARPAFRQLRLLADEHGLAERSMGMTADLEVAVEEGTTMVRVGSALFGPRPGVREMRH
jgi:PLP dependent protein